MLSCYSHEKHKSMDSKVADISKKKIRHIIIVIVRKFVELANWKEIMIEK